MYYITCTHTGCNWVSGTLPLADAMAIYKSHQQTPHASINNSTYKYRLEQVVDGQRQCLLGCISTKNSPIGQSLYCSEHGSLPLTVPTVTLPTDISFSMIPAATIPVMVTTQTRSSQKPGPLVSTFDGMASADVDTSINADIHTTALSAPQLPTSSTLTKIRAQQTVSFLEPIIKVQPIACTPTEES